jgi:uncharacterized membrane protein YdfJ with MMPL/SSD domain
MLAGFTNTLQRFLGYIFLLVNLLGLVSCAKVAVNIASVIGSVLFFKPVLLGHLNRQ